MQLVVGEGRMANEQIIYLGPEEELTNVRERLEHTKAGRITLVIPPQTQLRSHVGWRVLRSSVRELGQDVLVISSDPQIRAVAKAAGFRVAVSLESPLSDMPRPSNRPVRNDKGGKTSKSSSKQVGSGSSDSRSSRPGQQPKQGNLPTNVQQQAPQSSGKYGSTLSSPDEMNTGIGAAASSTFEIEDIPFDSHYDDISIETVPPMGSATADREENEVDPLVVDYYVARSIREAAQGADAGATPSASEMTGPSSSKPEQSSKIPPPSEVEDDPFAYMEDIQPVPLPEQRASTFIQDIDAGIPDIPDIPTDIHEVEIEDLGDEGEVMLQDDMSPHAWEEPIQGWPGMQETPRIYGMPPRSSRMGNTGRPLFEDLEDEDELLPIPDQPTQVTPSSPARSSGSPTPPVTASKREPQPIIQPPPQTRNVSVNPTVQQSRKTSPTQGSRTVTTPPVSRRASSISNRRGGSRITAIVVIGLAVVVLAVLPFLFFGSNATVTITVPSQPLSVTMQYVTSTNQHTTQNSIIPSQALAYTASATGQGSATGTIQQGNQAATGTVTFSNKGTQSLIIPTGTVLSTSGAVAVQFVTTAEPLVQPDSSGSPQAVVPVQAQLPGNDGNVAANSIIIIPPDSLTKIAQKNQIPTQSVNLTVTNPQSTTGGGSANVRAVSSNDVNTLALMLHQQVQNKIKVWLGKVVHPGDVAGTPVPNVLASPTLLPEEKMITTPAAGQSAPNGKFSGVLSVTVSVLVIRNATIQAAGKAQLMTAALHMKPAYVLTTQMPVNVKVTNNTPSKDGTTLSITVDAAGYIVPQVSTQAISYQLAGKSVDQAKSFHTYGMVAPPEIVLFPSFLGFMPFRPEQIHVIVQPGPVKGKPNG
jgi:baseplate J-like protein